MSSELDLPADLIEQLRQMVWAAPWRCHGLEGPAEGLDLDGELLREMPDQHVLFPYRHEVRAIARRDDCDDVLYWVPSAEMPFAVVHLTWQPNEIPPEIPATVLYESLAAFAKSEIESLRDTPGGDSSSICE